MSAPARILVVGDRSREVATSATAAWPGAAVRSVANVFDAIIELSAGPYTMVLAAAEPVERRPEAAVRTMREVAGEARLVLYGHPTLEPLARKMLEFGADDYVISPATPEELRNVLAAPPSEQLQVAPQAPAEIAAAAPGDLAVAEVALDALLASPQEAPATLLKHINELYGPALRFVRGTRSRPAPDDTGGRRVLSHPLTGDPQGVLHLLAESSVPESAARHLLAQYAHLLGKLSALQDRHEKLQKLAITDDLTGLHNGRYFRHFIARMIDKARAMRFPVTLLLFDIDNFKRYNDRYGHAVGDELLRQTAQMMRRSVRDHDLIARISGDEFAVVFWEKDGPRQRDPRAPVLVQPPGAAGRVPQNVLPILDRFRRLIASHTIAGLGTEGKGSLTISGGLAVYPYDAQTSEQLIHVADEALMFGAKKSGKNRIFLVGGEDQPVGPQP